MASGDLLAQAGLDETSRARRLAFLGFGPEDEARLEELRAFAEDNVDGIVEDFYRHLIAFEETRRVLGGDEQIARLKVLQRDYFLRMLEGDFDLRYFESRLRVGAAHARIDLRPEWYLGTYRLYVRLLATRLRERYPDDPDRLLALLETFMKVVYLDMGLAIDSYIMSGYVDRVLAQDYRRMAEVAEHALAEKARVERAKADLTGMIVHDLKGPLGGILAVAQLALRRGEDHDPSRRHFEQIQRSARDLMRMIENLLEIDQMREGRLELRLEPVDLGALLGECSAEYHAAAEMAGQVIAVDAGRIPIVVTDRWLLRRVLNNLVVNAIRHSAASRIDLGARLERDRVLLHVRDGGRGMSSEEQAHLFAKPERMQGAHRDDIGLGLVFCKMAVERMGGTIAVESAPGAGTAFTISLPIEGAA
ncbi:MAG TPA: protoglobin domain-containing protein [Candidatus Binatia bacterium]|jgi:signal transduction histidine kinase